MPTIICLWPHQDGIIAALNSQHLREALEMHRLKPEGIAESYEVVNRCGRKPDTKMEIELLVWRWTESNSGVQDVLRSTALRKFTAVFKKGAQCAGYLAIKQQARLAC